MKVRIREGSFYQLKGAVNGFDPDGRVKELSDGEAEIISSLSETTVLSFTSVLSVIYDQAPKPFYRIGLTANDITSWVSSMNPNITGDEIIRTDDGNGGLTNVIFVLDSKERMISVLSSTSIRTLSDLYTMCMASLGFKIEFLGGDLVSKIEKTSHDTVVLL